MSGADWLSYSLQDFVMFGPQVFLRLFVRINVDLWPWQLLGVAASLLIPFMLVSDHSLRRKLGLFLIGLAWMSSGYGFLVGYFGPINWPATGFGWAFVGQGAFLLFAVLRDTLPSRPVSRSPLFILWFLAVLALPWLVVGESGSWQSVAVFGVDPWATAAAGAVATPLLASAWRRLYLISPLVWALASAAMFWALATPWLLALPAATLVLLAAALWLSPRPARNPG
ncbi:MAG: hypothetical protein VX421_11880 [Pseudomonadota bacterium]|nr:hypothetical protein [Pseudomonadota bacterium]